MGKSEELGVFTNQSSTTSIPEFDEESKIGSIGSDDLTPDLQEGLKSRHVQLIALGGTIGTGLFIGSGGTLSTCGPAPLLIGYCILASIIFNVMNQLGVMVTYLPKQGSIAEIAKRYVDPSLGFATGCMYVYTMLILLPAEISAAAMIIQYWTDKVHIAVWIVIMLALIIFLNCTSVKYYGETEFWFASLKIILIFGLIIVGVVIFFGGGPAQHGILGFHYWKDPGAFRIHLASGSTGRFCDVWTAIVKSGFAFVLGPEFVCITASETKNPRRNISKAARRFVYRLIFFYIIGALIIGIMVPYNNKQLLNGSSDVSASPFVIGIHNSGIKVLNHIINAVVLTSALSASNSYFYTGTRYLYNMALDGSVPKIFKKTNKWGVPYYCVIFAAAIGCLSFMNVSSSSADVFNWLSNMCTISGFIGWIIIGVSFLRFREAIIYNGLLDSLPYKPIGAPYTTYYTVFFMSLLTITNGYAVFFHFKGSDFVAAYITIPFFLVFYLGHKIWTKNWTLYMPVEEIDVTSGVAEAEKNAAYYEDITPKPSTNWEKFVDWAL